MYKYFSELENPEEFIVYLSDLGFRNNIVSIDIKELDVNFYHNYSALFRYIKYIDSLIIPNITIEEANRYFLSCGEFLVRPDEDDDYSYIKGLGQKINLTVYELIEYFRFYLKYLSFYSFIFPNMKPFFNEIKKMINSALMFIESKTRISLSKSSGEKRIVYPNAWFITPSGYLYNTGGKNGHKEGSLVYAYNNIYGSMGCGGLGDFQILKRENENLDMSCSRKTSEDKIKKILEDGFVDYYEFQNYSNFIYQLKELIIPNGEENVSYQKNIITLVAGYLAARRSLYKAYEKLSDSHHKGELASRISDLCNGDLADILVRFAGFHKVESQRSRTICTSSLYGISLFKEYLDRGWNLDIIPGVVYDKKLDEVSDVNLGSVYIERHLDRELDNYHGKGKVLVNHVHYK